MIAGPLARLVGLVAISRPNPVPERDAEGLETLAVSVTNWRARVDEAPAPSARLDAQEAARARA